MQQSNGLHFGFAICSQRRHETKDIDGVSYSTTINGMPESTAANPARPQGHNTTKDQTTGIPDFPLAHPMDTLPCSSPSPTPASNPQYWHNSVPQPGQPDP